MELVIINENQNVYAENLCPAAANFVNDLTFNITGTGTVINSAKAFAGFGSSLAISNTSYNTANTLIASDDTDQLLTRALESGLYWLSFYFQIESGYSGENVPFKINVFKNGLAFEEFDVLLGSDTEGFLYDNWVRFAQQFTLTADDELTFSFEMGYDLTSLKTTVRVYLAGMSVIHNDKMLQQPPYYLPAKENETGWASYNDSIYTSSLPLDIDTGSAQTLINNAAVTELGYLPSGVTSLYSGVSNKILPVNVGDFYNICINFKAKNDNANGLMDFGIDLGGSVGITFKETLSFVKGANTEQEFTLNINTNAISEFVTNGGMPKLTKVTGNSEVYDIKFTVSRLIKSQSV